MSTSTSTSTTIKDGKMVTLKTVTTVDADGEKKIETFEEVKEAGEDDMEGLGGGDFFKNKMKELSETKGESSGEDERKDGKKTEVPQSSSSDDDEEEEEFSEFQLEALRVHNLCRAKHGVPPMELSKKICIYSQEWADKLLAENKFQHRGDHKYGENIFSSWSSNPKEAKGNVAVDSWYDEVKHYTFGQEPRGGPVTGHFTQVVWKTSTKLGIAVSQKDGKVIVVGNYSPPGNFIGSYTPNVPAPVSPSV